jgi:hypothetical protein
MEKPKTNGRRHVDRPVLILNGHGIQLRVKHGALIVQNGFTHYPQEREDGGSFPAHGVFPLASSYWTARGG